MGSTREPDDRDSPERITDEDLSEALASKGRALIERARQQREPVPTKASGDHVDTLRQGVAEQQLALVVAEDPKLLDFKRNFDRLNPKFRSRCSWAEVSRRLLANGGKYLALAKAMSNGGILFGIDQNGNPLFTDESKYSPYIFTNMDYKNTRKKVLYQHDESETMIIDEAGQPLPTGYEMFSCSDDRKKSEEILQYESTIGHFITSAFGVSDNDLWLESGDNPSFANVIKFNPKTQKTYIARDNADYNFRCRGCRRLLRVKES